MQGFLCTNCNFESITFKVFCPKCHHETFEETTFPNTGIIYSYTTIHVGSPDFADKLPYHVVLVEISNHLRVTGYMDKSVDIGDKVKLKQIDNNRYIFDRD